MKALYDKTLDYLALKVANFETNKRGKVWTFTCPACASALKSAVIIPFTDKIRCNLCKLEVGLFGLVRMLEPEKASWDNDSIIDYLSDLFALNIKTESKVDSVLKAYQDYGFDLVPVLHNDKKPIEQDWPNKTHKDISEWKTWLSNGLNIGIKTGTCSGITVVDVDTEHPPVEIVEILQGYEGVLQKTKKGYHYFFQYEPDVLNGPLSPPKIVDPVNFIPVDVRNDGGQVVAYPSEVEGHQRSFTSLGVIPKMPDALRIYLISKRGAKKEVVSDELLTLPEFDDSKVSLVGEGSRNNFLTHFGGILRKTLNPEETKFVLDLVNSKFIKPSVPSSELYNIVRSLDKYVRFEEKDLAGKVLKYLKVVGEATSRDVKEIVGESKELVDKTLAFLVKENYVIRKGRLFCAVRKCEWRETFLDTDKPIRFNMPFFHDVCNFADGDMLLLGGKTKSGKTTIVMNILKQLVEQSIKPNYVSLENGSRFGKTASRLGLVEGDFKWAPESEPTKIELEPGAVTIIDWLFIEDFASTNTVIKHLADQLSKHGGNLIVLAQLKEDGSWFAPNLIKNFPAFAARYVYDNDGDGSSGRWLIDAMRDAKDQVKVSSIPCKYDWKTRLLRRVEPDEQSTFG